MENTNNMELITITLFVLGINFLIGKSIVYLFNTSCIRIVNKYNNNPDFREYISDDVYSFCYDVTYKRRIIKDYLIFHFPILNIFLFMFFIIVHISISGKHD